MSYSSNELSNGLVTREILRETTLFYAPHLKFEGDKFVLLMCIAEMESSYGAAARPRYEAGYSRSSIAYRRSALLRQGHDYWGDTAAMSYGCHQILWVVAREHGFPLSSNPMDLQKLEGSLPFVIKYINSLIKSGATKAESIFRCYNGGLGALKHPNEAVIKYGEKALSTYSQLVSNKPIV